MRVVFLEDVEGVARGGEVKEVKNGFARNYLIPQNLAAPATHNNLQRIKKLSSQASITRVQRLEDMQELATALEGTQVNIEMRAGVNNRLYGSVTGTMVADAVVEETGREIERRLVQLDDPIREVGEYDVPIRLHSDVSASIKVVVYATGTDPLDNSIEKVAEGDQAVVDSTDTSDDPVNKIGENENEDTLTEATNVSLSEKNSESDEEEERTE